METVGKILIVDDELPVCKSIASALETEGYLVDMVQSGEEALEKQEQDDFDVMLVDLMMPGMSGMELLEAMKKRRPDIMVIMITGYPTMKTAVQAVKLGAYDYLPKPFTPRELRALVARSLSHRQLEKEKAAPAVRKEPAQDPRSGNIYCIPGHSWARIEEGQVRVGVHETLLMTVGNLSSIDFPYEGERISQGEACLWLVDQNQNLHRVWAPVSGKVVRVHKELQADVSKVQKDPYEAGWMLLIEPDRLEDDMTNLVPLDYHK
jgi:CheY-like chemotaxis protein/glycine cleavage system H lipoate-binding protein